MRLLMMALLLSTAAACASTGDPASRRSRSQVSLEEIERARGASTAYDLVRRLRPDWLRGRGSGTFNRTAEGGILVYVDGIRAGVIAVTPEGSQMAGPNPLGGIPAEQVAGLRYYTSSEATQRFGTGHAYGAIDVITRRSSSGV